MNDLICPICAQPLLPNMQGIACVNKHQYDRAKEGYFNLLPVHHKHSREPGDPKEQLQARRQFLSAGFFAPLADALLDLMPSGAAGVVDIGCGEGYFTQLFARHCSAAQVYGIDIAKVGVRMAAKAAAGSNLSYAVASSYALPLADNSMDVMVRIYAPSKDEELSRVLKPHGTLIVVTPGEKHLLNLRTHIYQQIKPYQQIKTPVGFDLVGQKDVSFSLNIPSGEFTHALLQMTPFAWKLRDQVKSALIASGLSDTADFQISVYQKNKNAA